MRTLLESSWMKFGPAGRDFVDWSPGPSALPSTDTGQTSGEAIFSARVVTYIIIASVSFVVLLFLGGVFGLLALRRRRRIGGFGLDGGKLGLANVIALEDLQDPERNCELLRASIRRSRRERRRSSSASGSGEDVTDGVFLMVYLPSPYEQTLTRITRAASTRSSRNVELMPPSSPGLPELCRREEDWDEDGKGGDKEARMGVKDEAKEEAIQEKEPKD